MELGMEVKKDVSKMGVRDQGGVEGVVLTASSRYSTNVVSENTPSVNTLDIIYIQFIHILSLSATEPDAEKLEKMYIFSTSFCRICPYLQNLQFINKTFT